eukprot:SAG31_NODE_2051_length_6559_cov_370.073684_4_plen_247_part_00
MPPRQTVRKGMQLRPMPAPAMYGFLLLLILVSPVTGDTMAKLRNIASKIITQTGSDTAAANLVNTADTDAPIPLEAALRMMKERAQETRKTAGALHTKLFEAHMKRLHTPVPCIDTEQHCQAWASAGECDANPVWMMGHCRLSCSHCNAEVPQPSPPRAASLPHSSVPAVSKDAVRASAATQSNAAAPAPPLRPVPHPAPLPTSLRQAPQPEPLPVRESGKINKLHSSFRTKYRHEATVIVCRPVS